MLDINFLKNYNDRHGHQQGDRVLRAVAGVLGSVVPSPGDLAARYGGEEKAALLVGCDLAGARAPAEEARRAVERLNLNNGDSPVLPVVTVSLGVAAARPWPGSRARELVHVADQALYRAKDGGRNRVESQVLELTDPPLELASPAPLSAAPAREALS